MPDTLALNPLADDQKLLARVIDYYRSQSPVRSQLRDRASGVKG